MTAVLTKLFERVILNRIKEFLVKNKLIIKEQSGFRKNRSTKDNLVYLTQKIAEALGS
jgi:hypothetical protein